MTEQVVRRVVLRSIAAAGRSVAGCQGSRSGGCERSPDFYLGQSCSFGNTQRIRQPRRYARRNGSAQLAVRMQSSANIPFTGVREGLLVIQLELLPGAA